VVKSALLDTEVRSVERIVLVDSRSVLASTERALRLFAESSELRTTAGGLRRAPEVAVSVPL
jgi:hypothetical protein